MQRKFDKFYKTSVMVMLVIIIILLCRIGGGGYGSDTSKQSSTIIYIPIYEPFKDTDGIIMNKEMPCSLEDIRRFKAQGNVGVLPCNGASMKRNVNPEISFNDSPILYNAPNSLGEREPVKVSSPGTIGLFFASIIAILFLRKK